jgi:TM2 domain-containing membrane protein YozV
MNRFLRGFSVSLFCFFSWFPLIAAEEEALPLPRDPQVALRKAFLPGWGQFYNQRPVKGLLAIGLEIAALGSSFYWQEQSKKAIHPAEIASYSFRRDLSYCLSLWIWLYFIMDAYVDAHFSAEEFIFEIPEEQLIKEKK